MVINTLVTLGVFLIVGVGGALVTWPNVPWTALLVSGVALNLIVPIAFYPVSKTLWLAIEMSYNPPDEPKPTDQP